MKIPALTALFFVLTSCTMTPAPTPAPMLDMTLTAKTSTLARVVVTVKNAPAGGSFAGRFAVQNAKECGATDGEITAAGSLTRQGSELVADVPASAADLVTVTVAVVDSSGGSLANLLASDCVAP